MDTWAKAFAGTKNIYEGMAGSISSRLADVRKEGIKSSLKGLHDEAHRLETIAVVRGITFIDDSRATNVNASWYAMETMSRPVVWIAGGQDRGNDYRMLVECAADKVKALICLGKDNRHMMQFFRHHIEVIMEAEHMEDAVRTAYMAGAPGDVVLLSPACPSFDRFDHYKDRGMQFRQAVIQL